MGGGKKPPACCGPTRPSPPIAVQGTPQGGGGRLIAVGDANGTVSLLEVSENLAVPQVRSSMMEGIKSPCRRWGSGGGVQ